MSAPSDGTASDEAAIAAAARREAFFEVAMVARHDLSTALHVAQAALDACARGDVVRAHRLLTSSSERIKGTLAQLEEYGGKSRTAPRVRLVDVHHVVVETLRARLGLGSASMPAPAPVPVPVPVPASVRIDVELEPSIAEAPLAVPRSVLALTLLAMADAVSQSSRSGRVSTVHVRALTDEPSEGVLRIACVGGPPTPDSLHIQWAKRELEPWGGRLWGPLEVQGESQAVYAASFPRSTTP